MAKRMMALALMLMMLVTQCAPALAADFTTWNKGTILTDPTVYFGSDKYRFAYAWDDRDADFKWNWVTYVFHSKGKDTQMQDGYEYAKKLEATGFFDIVEETSREGRWEIRYIGKEKKLNLSKSGTSPEGKWHVLVLVNAGTDDNEFRVLLVDGIEFYDIENPKKPVNSTSKPTTKPTTKPTAVRTKECPECEGSGKCSECGGDMWVWKTKWVYVMGSPEMKTVNELCHGQYCYGGSCDKCGGDGRVEY